MKENAFESVMVGRLRNVIYPVEHANAAMAACTQSTERNARLGSEVAPN